MDFYLLKSDQSRFSLSTITFDHIYVLEILKHHLNLETNELKMTYIVFADVY